MLTWQIEFFLFVVTAIDTYLELMGKVKKLIVESSKKGPSIVLAIKKKQVNKYYIFRQKLTS